MESQRNPALALLLERRSDPHLCEPAPDGDELALMMSAARRVPDFHHLQPYRFLLAQGEGRLRLGALMQEAALAAGKPETTQERVRRMPQRAPLIILVVASPQPNPLVPLFDQQLAAGCTVLTLQLAARALGYGAIWRSGWLMYDKHFARLLGLGPEEHFVGFLYVDTVDLGVEVDSAAEAAPLHLNSVMADKATSAKSMAEKAIPETAIPEKAMPEKAMPEDRVQWL